MRTNLYGETKYLQTRSSWLNSALRGVEAVYLVSVRQQWLVLYDTESEYQRWYQLILDGTD